jgi:hypothetical protein
MTKVYLVTNDGSGEDGDEWLLGSIHATKDGAEEAKALGSWYRCVEEWEMEGSLLTDAEREAIEGAIIHMETRGVWAWPATLRGLLERLA